MHQSNQSNEQILFAAECSNIMCAMYCPHGFEQNAAGCDICKCASKSFHTLYAKLLVPLNAYICPFMGKNI